MKDFEYMVHGTSATHPDVDNLAVLGEHALEIVLVRCGVHVPDENISCRSNNMQAKGDEGGKSGNEITMNSSK